MWSAGHPLLSCISFPYERWSHTVLLKDCHIFSLVMGKSPPSTESEPWLLPIKIRSELLHREERHTEPAQATQALGKHLPLCSCASGHPSPPPTNLPVKSSSSPFQLCSRFPHGQLSPRPHFRFWDSQINATPTLR